MFMDEDKIVLDKESFEALAVDTRVKILKSLKERRKTLTELSKETGMSVSGIKEHLEILEKTHLIEKIDDGHKWKYYELTRKGKNIVGPKEFRVLVLLSISLIALAASFFMMVPPAPVADEPMMLETAAAGEAQRVNDEDLAPKALAVAAPDEFLDEPDHADQNLVATAIGLISGLTIIACLAILAKNRMR